MLIAHPSLPKRTSLLAGMAMLAAISGMLAALRLTSSGRQDLLLATLTALMVISMVVDRQIRALVPQLLLAIGAAFAIGSSLIETSSEVLAALSILAVALALASLFSPAVRNEAMHLPAAGPTDSLRSASSLVPGCAIVVSLLLAGALALDQHVSPAAMAVCAAAAAVLALGIAIRWFALPTDARFPQALSLAMASIALIAIVFSAERIWLTASVLLTGTAIALETLPDHTLNSPPPAQRTPTFSALMVASMAVASGAAALAVSFSGDMAVAWPLFGAMSVGFIGLGSAAYDAAMGSREKTLRLERSAREGRFDALTGLTNRRGIDERIADELARAERYDHPLSLLILDLDDFKHVNDRDGHAAGDDALRAAAQVIRESLRSIDIPARYGGEEFLVILPETEIAGAQVVGERIRRAIEQTGVTTVSIGVAERHPDRSDSASLLDAADQALYVAKRTGKNRIVLAS